MTAPFSDDGNWHHVAFTSTGSASAFFVDGPVTNYETAAASDTERFGRFFHGMLKRGVYVAPSQFEALGFEHFFLQPLDDPMRQENTDAAVRYCLANPQWRLSVQAHKYIGVA